MRVFGTTNGGVYSTIHDTDLIVEVFPDGAWGTFPTPQGCLSLDKRAVSLRSFDSTVTLPWVLPANLYMGDGYSVRYEPLDLPGDYLPMGMFVEPGGIYLPVSPNMDYFLRLVPESSPFSHGLPPVVVGDEEWFCTPFLWGLPMNAEWVSDPEGIVHPFRFDPVSMKAKLSEG